MMLLRRQRSPSFARFLQQFQQKLFSTSPEKPFDKVLIANRGEIVSRVVRTCQSLDIDTVAVYSTADRKAPFVKDATEAYCIGPAASSESYLNIDAILEAIQDSGAQAVHPGYGFLSESAVFSKAITSHGITWLGPSVEAIEAMGDKISSKQLAINAGVSVVPGYEGALESIQHAQQIVRDEIGGYPILLKAAAGGGGKGMRVCRSDEELQESFPLAKAEALQFFSDDRLMVEKYVENPHHIEFQVLSAWNPETGELDVCVFCERECSIQRRHQKILEESPSPLLREDTRVAMVDQVKRLVQQVGYTSAGTVEWLVDEEQNFYFLEMNTRLQVEHPVTEMVCSNVDLVKGMLWEGAGWGLPPEIADNMGAKPYFPCDGYAMEARLYAEDPLRGFLPSTGPLLPYQEPQRHDFLRIDSGVAEGHVVTPHYDPMLSKVIAYDPDSRIGAIERLASAMEEYVVGPAIQHNGRLVLDVLRNESYRKGDTPTSFLEKHYPDGFQGVELSSRENHELAAFVAIISRQQDPVVVRFGGMFGTQAFQVTKTKADDGSFTILDLHTEGSEPETIKVTQTAALRNHLARFDVDGTARVMQVISQRVTGEWRIEMNGLDMEVLVQSPREYELSQYMKPPKKVDTSSMLISPMPGVLVSLAVEEGDSVEIGQELCIVEAMKMQNIIRAPRAGIIAKCRVRAGASLMADDVIIDFEPEVEPGSVA